MTETTMERTYEAWREERQHAYDMMPTRLACRDEQLAVICDRMGAQRELHRRCMDCWRW